MNKRVLVICFGFLAAVSAFWVQPLTAATRGDVLTGVTTGKQKIYNQNIQEAKQQAVDQALETALQNAFASLVSREILAANLDFFYEQVASRTSDYIRAYRVMGGVESKGYYLVGVETKVDLALLEKKLTDARILSAGKDKPTILFLIAEKTLDDLQPKYWWGKEPVSYSTEAEQIIMSQMLEDDFRIAGAGPDRPDLSFYDISFDTIYDITAARNLGVQMKADMIVFGKAVSSESINRMGDERTFDAVVSLEAYHLETGEKALSLTQEAAAKSQVPVIGHTNAINTAAGAAAGELSRRLAEFWTNQLRRERSFEVRIEGDHFLPRFIALKQRFAQMPGIENMQPKEMGSDYALLEVFYKGKPGQFADTVMLKTFEAFGLEILAVTDSLVTIRFIEKQESLFGDESPVNAVPAADDPIPEGSSQTE